MKQIKATHASACLGCGSGIDEGETFWWAPSEAFCLDCGPPAAGQPAGATTTDEDVPGYVLHLRHEIKLLKHIIEKHSHAFEELRKICVRQNNTLIAFAEWAFNLAEELDIDPPEMKMEETNGSGD